MPGPATQIKTLRLTAKLLLAATPLMLVSGFLTAKPYLLDAIGFQAARTAHTFVAPLVFLPLLLVHSTAGLLYMLGREKRWKGGPVPRIFAVAWNVLLLGLAALYFVARPAVVEVFDDELDGDVAATGSDVAGGDAGAAAFDGAADGDVARLDADGPLPAKGAAGRDGGADNDEDRGARPDAEPPTRAKAAPPSRRRAERRARRSRRPRGAERAPVTPDASPAPPEIVAQPEKARPRTPASSEEERRATPAPPQESPPAKAPLSGAKLVRARCVQCHDLSTVYGEKRSAAGWRATLNRMIAQGAALDAAERAAVLRHLVARAGR